MRTLQPLLDRLKHIDDPGILRATLGALLIAVEEHPTITTSQKAQVFDATALCIHDLGGSLDEPDVCIECASRHPEAHAVNCSRVTRRGPR